MLETLSTLSMKILKPTLQSLLHQSLRVGDLEEVQYLDHLIGRVGSEVLVEDSQEGACLLVLGQSEDCPAPASGPLLHKLSPGLVTTCNTHTRTQSMIPSVVVCFRTIHTVNLVNMNSTDHQKKFILRGFSL